MSPAWIDLDGTRNTRDVGGLPLTQGGGVRSGRLLRSDNLQSLSAQDVLRLVTDYRLETVVDLRTTGEITHEGPTALHGESGVSVHHLSLLPEPVEERTAAQAAGPSDGAAPPELPWQDRTSERARASARHTYARYLDERPDSVLTALRLISTTDGATLVHCAAGKDRTGVVVALALSEVGVDREAIVADYVASSERVPAVLARLAGTATYAGDEGLDDMDRHRPKAATLHGFFDDLDATSGGPAGWLRQHGWTDADAAALRASLIGP